MRGGKRKGAGRPSGSTQYPNLKMRSMRLTDEEYQKIKDYLYLLRQKDSPCPFCEFEGDDCLKTNCNWFNLFQTV